MQVKQVLYASSLSFFFNQDLLNVLIINLIAEGHFKFSQVKTIALQLPIIVGCGISPLYSLCGFARMQSLVKELRHSSYQLAGDPELNLSQKTN